MANEAMNEQSVQLSQKMGALVSIYQLGGYVREVEPVLNHMRSKLGINSDGHNIAHVLWPLSKENLVTFLERKGPSKSSVLTNIRLTESGADRARRLLGESDDLPGSSKPKIIHPRGVGRGRHAVGQDMTNYRQHAAVAVGGPIETRHEKETVLDGVPFVVLPEEEAARYRAMPRRHASGVERTAELNQQNPIDAETTEVDGKSTAADTPPQYLNGDTPREYPIVAAARTWADFEAHREEYPNIVAVLSKKSRIARYQQAAELLEEDEAEIAITLLEKVKITPLEEEIIRLLS